MFSTYCRSIGILILLTVGLQGWSQDYAVVISPDSLTVNQILVVDTTFNSESDVRLYLENKTDSLRQYGYLAAALDAVVFQDSLYLAEIYLGQQYQPESIGFGNIDSLVIDRLPQYEITDWQDVEELKEKLLNTYLDMGYLNATLRLDDISLSNDKISGNFYAEANKQYRLGEINTDDDVVITEDYLRNYFDLERNQVLSEDFMDRIIERTSLSPFFELEDSPGFILNADGTADIQLDLKKINSNEFDLIFGFIPNPNQQLSSRSLLLTGEGKLNLYNPLGGGRRLNVEYYQLQPESPRFDLGFDWPYIVNGIIGLNGDFHLYKQDTSYVDVNYSFGGHYFFGKNDKVEMSFNRNTSFLQEIDTASVRINKVLPESVDFKQSLYRIEFEFDRRNDIRSPIRGWRFKGGPAVGSRTIQSNREVTSLVDGPFDFSSLYQNVNDKKFTLHGNWVAEAFLPVGRRSTTLLRNNSGVRYYDSYFVNDLYKLGGIQTIRGFDEQQYLASKYSVNTVEYRYLLGRQSYFSAFADGAYLYNDRNAVDPSQFVFGLGSGINLSTKAGLFSLALAVGKEDQSSFDLKKSRIHIGYVNVF